MPARPLRFESLTAAESIEARAEVVGWAEDLYVDQLRTWEVHKATDRRNRTRPPTLAECRAKSAEIRRKRERDATYFNQLTNPHPTR